MTTFFQTESVGSLEKRALTPAGIDLLEYIADRERRLQHTFQIDTLRMLQKGKRQPANELHALQNAGFVSAHKFESSGPSNNVSFSQKRCYKLTDAGWDIVGNKPIWIEGSEDD